LTESFSAVISGLDENDYIDLKDLTFTSAADMQAHTSYLDGSTTLQITKLSTSQSLTFTLVGNYTSSTWIFDIDGAGGTKFHDPPAASADATTVANSTSTDLTSTVTAALTTQDGSADQFAFQSDSQSNTLADPTLIASTVPSATDATTSDTTQSSPDDTSATATLADASTTTTTCVSNRRLLQQNRPKADMKRMQPRDGWAASRSIQKFRSAQGPAIRSVVS
jgi:predicted NAD/FAD-dependent oxidoreductase